MIDEEPEGAIHLHIKHHSALSLLLPYWLRQRTGELWIQPDAAADLNRHGFALKSLQWCPLEETGERILVQFPAVDNICVARTKTFDNLSLPLFNKWGIFNISSHPYMCAKNDCHIFPKLPFCMCDYVSNMMRSFLRQMPHWCQRHCQSGRWATCRKDWPGHVFLEVL